jgi:CTP:molybdopterin cytidylyltransferase MocA
VPVLVTLRHVNSATTARTTATPINAALVRVSRIAPPPWLRRPWAWVRNPPSRRGQATTVHAVLARVKRECAEHTLRHLRC